MTTLGVTTEPGDRPVGSLPLVAVLAARVRAWGAGIASRSPELALGLVLLLALVFRLVNLGYDSLSHDECWRANWAHHGTLNQLRWFPPAQLLVYAGLQHLGLGSEFWLRLPDALFGAATVLLTFVVAHRRLGAWAGVVAAGFVAFHHNALFYSRVLKEFAWETAAVLLLLWAAARAVERPTRRRVVLFFVAAAAGLLVGFSPLLVALAGGLLILRACWRDPAQRRARLLTLAGCLSVFLPLLVAWYWWLDGCEHRHAVIRYFDTNEHAWLTARDPASIARWLLAKGLGWLRFVTGATGMTGSLAPAVMTATALAALAGLRTAWQRWPVLVQSLGIVVLINIALALLQRWPFGEYRSELFVVPLFALLVGTGLVEIATRLRRVEVTAALVTLCLLVPAARAMKHTIIDPNESEHLRPVLAQVEALSRPGDGYLAYYAAGPALEHYWAGAGDELYIQPIGERGRLDLFQAAFDALAARHSRVWLVFTHGYATEPTEWTASAQAGRSTVYHFGEDDTFAVCVQTQ